MMIDRRTFIQRAVFVAATPAIAALFSPPSSAQSHLSTVSNRLPQTAETRMDANSIMFKIDGWNCGGDIALDRLSANTVLIRINQSWQTVWR
jgi:hypothetical protein